MLLIKRFFVNLDPFRDLVSAMSDEDEDDEDIEDELEASEAIEEAEEGTSLETTSSTTTTTVPPLPKSCPAPDVTYNGSLLASVEAFKDIHDVEFEVRTGPFPGDSQRCKLSCVKGQWVGPLCRTDEGMYSFFVFVCLYFETRDRSA